MILVEAISREFRVDLPQKLLYDYNLVAIVKTEDDLIKRLNEWKDNMDSRGRRVNINKAKTRP